jgi:hypothetical protein
MIICLPIINPILCIVLCCLILMNARLALRQNVVCSDGRGAMCFSEQD